MNWLDNHPAAIVVILFIGFGSILGAMFWAVSRAEDENDDDWFI